MPGQSYSQQVLTVYVNGEDKTMSVFQTKVSEHYLKTLDIKIAEGRDFYENENIEQSSIMVNESFVKAYVLTAPIGMIIDGETIIGVVNDFNFNSLHQSVGPMIIRLGDNSQTSMMIRADFFDSKNIASLIPIIKNRITEIVPDTFVEVKFLNDNIGQ